jgi:hypothetical protein
MYTLATAGVKIARKAGEGKGGRLLPGPLQRVKKHGNQGLLVIRFGINDLDHIRRWRLL